MPTSSPAPRNKPKEAPLNFPRFSQDYLDKYAASNLRKAQAAGGSALLYGIARSLGGIELIGEAFKQTTGAATSDPIVQSRLCALFSLLVTTPASVTRDAVAGTGTSGAADAPAPAAPKSATRSKKAPVAVPQSLLELLDSPAVPEVNRKQALLSLRSAMVVARSQLANNPKYSDSQNPAKDVGNVASDGTAQEDDSLYALMKLSAGAFHDLVYGSLFGMAASAPKNVELVTTNLRATHSVVVPQLVRALLKLMAPRAITPQMVDMMSPEEVLNALKAMTLALEQQYARPTKEA